MTVLAGDIGGTNTRLAIYDAITAGAAAGDRPAFMPLFERTYPSAAHASLDGIAEAFLAVADLGGGAKVASACFGIAGPIENNMCRATNLPWVVDGRALSVRLGIPTVTLVNDFYAAALGVTVVGPADLVPLGGGPPAAQGPIAVLGAGTGLGQAFLLWSAADNRYQVVSSEGGHVDLAARTPLEQGLVQFLTVKYGRVSCERVLSGQGLVDVFAFLSEEPACRGLGGREAAALLGGAAGHKDPAAAISERALAGDGARHLLLRARRGGRQPRPHGAGHGRRVRRRGDRPPDPAVLAARRLPRRFRPEGAPPHARRAHPGLCRHPPAARPARGGDRRRGRARVTTVAAGGRA